MSRLEDPDGVLFISIQSSRQRRDRQECALRPYPPVEVAYITEDVDVASRHATGSPYSAADELTTAGSVPVNRELRVPIKSLDCSELDSSDDVPADPSASLSGEKYRCSG